MFVLFLVGIVSLVNMNNGDLQIYHTEAQRICYKCSKFYLGTCYDVMGFCIPKYYQSCAVENIYTLTNRGKYIYHYSKLSCMNKCEDINILASDKKTEIICCNQDPFCNIPMDA
uniref:Prostate and testis expressed 2 n=1 Tax=Rousettus aegyptiacus TaxID=9407 RepID=A0A7J8H508_ROUAE|nr:prostate and testis expressed 2 [Rousettus aegyptiacus]